MDRFEKIAQEMIAKAEQVQCESAEFRRGLATIYHALVERLEMEGVNPSDPEYLE